jgi:ribose 5-phosphate isomerase B
LIVIGSDHTGIKLKEDIIKYLKEIKMQVEDVTDYKNQEGDDYPDIAKVICQNVLKNKNNLGIAICGTGIGISIACNKFNRIRAALCVDSHMAKMSRNHNNSNVLCLGAMLPYAKDFENVKEILNEYLNNDFEGDRHNRRIEKIREIEILNLKGGKEYGNSI